MAILLLIAAFILICVIVLVVKNRGLSRRAATPDRFKHVGPGEAKPKEPRATGLD